MKSKIFKYVKIMRMIDYLREKYPETTWRYNKKAHEWQGGDGSWVWAVACLAPLYDGDDDTFVTRYYRYFPDGRMAQWVR